MREAIQHELDAVAYSQVNAAGLIASEAAYKYVEEWLDDLLKYIHRNIDFTSEFIRNHLPDIKFTPIEATYLAWLDFSGLKKIADRNRRHHFAQGEALAQQRIAFRKIGTRI